MPFKNVFPLTQVVSSYTCTSSYSAEYSRGPSVYLQGYLSVHLCSPFSSGTLSCEHYQLHPNSEIPLSCAWLCLPAPQPGTSPKVVSCSNYRAFLACFLSSRDHSPSLPVVHCLEHYCGMLSFSFSGRRCGNRSPLCVISSEQSFSS